MSSKLLRYSAISFAIVSLVAFLAYTQSLINVGYVVLTPQAGSPAPASTALLRTTNSEGVLVSETGMPAVRPVRSGLIYVDELATRTGLVFVNPFDLSATLTLLLRDAAGAEVDRRVITVEPRRQLVRFAAEMFGSSAANLRGSLSFQSDQSVAAGELRQSFNGRGEAIYTAMPVIDYDLNESASALIPYVRSGDGYSTEIVLLNRSAQRARGRVRLFSSQPSESLYDIPANGIQRMDVGGISPQTGYVEAAADPGTATPGGLAIIQLRSADGILSETAVPQAATNRAWRIFVESAGTQTRLSLANPNTESTETTFTLLDRFGTTISSVTRTLPPKGFLSIPADEMFSSVSLGFLGQIEIESDAPVSTAVIRSTLNSRNDLILASLPVAGLTLQTPSALILPQLTIGNGFSSRLIFTNRDARAAAAGQIGFFRSDGSPMDLTLPDGTGHNSSYELSARGSRQLFPGSTATVGNLSLRDPVSNAPTSELTINQGEVARPSLLVIDSSGIARDDFKAVPVVTNSDVASVDSSGAIVGRSAGFSTLAIAAGGSVVTGTVTVVNVESGFQGYEISGVAVDSARKFYMASSEEHTILLSQDLHQSPSVWAGTLRASGFTDDTRLASQFHNPSHLTLQANGTVYVSDSNNNVIRQIRPGPNGRVTTIAGNGVAGASDDAGRSATFRNPQGVALDDRGYLWVADSGNHIIRRINLATGLVTTIAGQPGVSGLADGRGADALFRSPTGIAFEPEPLVEELARERDGRPRTVRMIVADTGNGAIRRVTENGEVETVLQGPLQSPARVEDHVARVTPLGAATFNSPVGVALDAAGTIYVAEAGDVRAILPTGSVVRAAQAGTLVRPKGIAIAENGRLVVADSKAGAQQIRFGEPEIESVTPDRISGRGGARVTIRGRNFAPETIVILTGTVIRDATIADTETIRFTAPQLESGRTTLTLQNRGGLAQRDFLIDPIPLQELPSGSITTIVGGTTFTGDGGPAVDAPVARPEQTAIDASGNVYFADTSNHRIRKVDRATGVITTVAGNGDIGLSGDGGPAIAATFTFPAGVALDGSGNLFIADTGNSRIRRVDAVTGVIATIAGRRLGYGGDEGPAIAADLNAPRGLALDAAGNLYVADSTNHRIRKITVAGFITTVAGNGQADFSGDNGPATAAALNSPRALAVDSSGNLWIADTFNGRIRWVDAAGVIRTIDAGTLGFPRGIAVGVDGDVFVSDTGNHRILRVNSAGSVSTVAGAGTPGFSGDRGSPTEAFLNEPYGLSVDGAGILVIADRGNNRIRRIAEGGERRLTPIGVSLGPKVITTIAGNGQLDFIGDEGPATAARLRSPSAVVSDASGNLFVADSANHRIRRVDRAAGTISTVAGTGRAGFAGDGGLAAEALINFPQGLAIDGAGAIYIADTENHRIRRIDPVGVIRTFAGTGVAGYSGANGRAESALLSHPTGIAIDRQGNVYIADTGNHRIRRVAAETGLITTVAGNGGTNFSSDERPATEVSLNSPRSVAVDSSGNLYIADSGDDQIRRVDFRTQIIQRIAGTGERTFYGDGGPALAAALNFPLSVAIDRAGAVLILDSFNHRLRHVQTETGVIRTIAGIGIPGFLGDGGPAADAMLWAPSHVAVDAAGNILLADTVNHRIRGIVVSSPSR